MARIVDAKYSTMVGTPTQLRDLLRLMTGTGASVVDFKFSNFVVLNKPIDSKALAVALGTTPSRQKG